MKIKGQSLGTPPTEVVVIPRSTGDIVIQARPIMDYTEFDKLCPRPKAPQKLLPGGEIQENITDKGYQEKLDTWAKQKTSWMFITSLSATEELEWESVKADDPSTWGNYVDELSNNFTPAEQNSIAQAVWSACGLTQSKIEEATKRFLAMRQAPA